MKLEKIKSFFVSHFSKKEKNKDMRTDETDDYTIQRNQKTDVIIRILSILGAIFIWIYVVLTDVASYEFTDIPVEVRNVDAVEAEGYAVSYNTLRVTFRIQGSNERISAVNADSAKAYVNLLSVDLSEIVGTKTVKVPIVYSIPDHLTCMEQSQDYMEITISVVSPETTGSSS